MSSSFDEPDLRPARRPWPVAFTGLGAVALLAACGSGAAGTTAGSSTSPSVAPSATGSMSCAQVTALRAALANVGRIRVNAHTGSQILADLTEVGTALTAMKGGIGSAFAVEAHLLSADLTTIGRRARALSSNPSPANLRATTTAVAELKTAAAAAIVIMRRACPSS